MRTVVSGLQIRDADNRVERTPAFRRLMARSGRYAVRSGRTTISGTMANIDGKHVEVAFDSWYWTGRGYRAEPGFNPFRLSDITETRADAAHGLRDALRALSRMMEHMRHG